MRPMGRRDSIHPDMGGDSLCGMEEGGTVCRSAEDVDRISREAEMMRAEEHLDAVDETAGVYIYRMPDGTLGIQCGNCGAPLPQIRVPAGQRGGRSVPARCPGCGPEIVDIQGTGDCEGGDE